MSDILTIAELSKLSEVIAAASTNAPVAILDPETMNVDYGQARSVGTETGGLNPVGVDVRDMFLRITMESGVERFERVADLAAGLNDTFYPNYSHKR